MLDITPFPCNVDDDLELVPFSQEYTAALFSIVNRDRTYLRQWQNWPDRIRTIHDMRNMVADSCRRMKYSSGLDLVLCYQGQVAGKIGLTHIDWHKRHSEIGYWIAFDFQRRGLMTQACRILVNYALLYLNLRSIQIRCAKDNIRSAAIPRRLGFSFVNCSSRKIWIHNKVHHEYIYILKYHEWSSRMIYHITTKTEWEAAQDTGFYSHPTLNSQGFIHFSNKDQISKVANTFFTRQGKLVILCVDPSLLTAPLKHEPPNMKTIDDIIFHTNGELFPHLYGTLPINAVVNAVEFSSDPDGLSLLLTKL